MIEREVDYLTLKYFNRSFDMKKLTNYREYLKTEIEQFNLLLLDLTHMVELLELTDKEIITFHKEIKIITDSRRRLKQNQAISTIIINNIDNSNDYIENKVEEYLSQDRYYNFRNFKQSKKVMEKIFEKEISKDYIKKGNSSEDSYELGKTYEDKDKLIKTYSSKEIEMERVSTKPLTGKKLNKAIKEALYKDKKGR